MDNQFYSLVIGEKDAFYKMCMVLPCIIEEVVRTSENSVLHVTVIGKQKNISSSKDVSFAMAVYMLGFKTY